MSEVRINANVRASRVHIYTHGYISHDRWARREFEGPFVELRPVSRSHTLPFSISILRAFIETHEEPSELKQRCQDGTHYTIVRPGYLVERRSPSVVNYSHTHDERICTIDLLKALLNILVRNCMSRVSFP